MAVPQAELRYAIPNELIHHILKCVLSYSIHKICLFPAQQVRKWHYHVIPTLCSVSLAFQAITKELAAKALAIKEDESRCGFSFFLSFLSLNESVPIQASPGLHEKNCSICRLWVFDSKTLWDIPRVHLSQQTALHCYKHTLSM
jgi:hypothetical protein